MALKQIQLVCAALAAGMLAAAAICGGVTFAGMLPPSRALIPPLAGIVALSFPAGVLLSIAVGSSQAQAVRMRWLRQEDADAGEAADEFEASFARSALLRIATLEGFGMLGAVSALLTGELLFLVAPAVAVVGMGVVFPTGSKYRAYVDRLTQPVTDREQRLIDATR